MAILQMSAAAAILILAIVVVLWLAIHRLPKRTFIFLWGVVALRLLIPFSIPVAVPLGDFVNFDIPSNFAVSTASSEAPIIADIAEARVEQYAGLIPNIQQWVPHPSYEGMYYATETFARQSAPNIFSLVIAIVWGAGILALAMFFVITHLRCRREYNTSLPVNIDYIAEWQREQKLSRPIQVRQLDKIAAPLTYGIIKPVILFPKTTDWQDKSTVLYVLTHEMMHIKSFDILMKWLFAVALCIHWFNPLVWVMFMLANRDIEFSCDEAVVKSFGISTKSAYAMTLIEMEESKLAFAPLCTNFSQNAIQERIVAIMKIKKTSLIGALASFALVGTATAVFASISADASAPLTPVLDANPMRQIDIYLPAPVGLPEGFYLGAPTENCITAEEAMEIAADALEQLFGADMNGVTMSLFYSTRLSSGNIVLAESVYMPPEREFPATWSGYINPNNSQSHDVFPQYSFLINAETGGIIDVTYWPDAAEVYASGRGRTVIESSIARSWNNGDFDSLRRHNVQDNYILANRAMEIAENANLFDGEIARAKIVSYFIDITLSEEEATIRTSVNVQCVNGENIRIHFRGLLDEEQVFTGIYVIGNTHYRGLAEPDFGLDWVAR